MMTANDEFAVRINRILTENAKFAATRQEHLLKRRQNRDSSAVQNRISQLKSEKARFYMSFQSYGSFGSDTPRWTIPSSRKPPPPPDSTPAPGNYNIPSIGIEVKGRGFTFSKAETDFTRNPNKCEVMLTHDFPDIQPGKVPIQISTKSNLDHFYLPTPVSPSPTYVPPGLGSHQTRSIGSKYKDDRYKTISPGPGRYTPKDTIDKKSFTCSVPRSKRRDLFEEYKNDNPGPGSYDVTPPIRRAPRWTSLSRKKTKRIRTSDTPDS